VPSYIDITRNEAFSVDPSLIYIGFCGISSSTRESILVSSYIAPACSLVTGAGRSTTKERTHRKRLNMFSLTSGAFVLGLAASAQARIVEHWWNITYATANPDGVSVCRTIVALTDARLTRSCTNAESSVSTEHGREFVGPA